MKKLVVVALVGVVAVVLSAGGAWIWISSRVDVPMATGDAALAVFTVPKGATGKSLGRLLVEHQLIQDARAWRFFLWRRGTFQPKAGRHELRATMTIPQIVDALEKAPLPDDEPFSMIEGWRLRDTDAALVAKGFIEPGAYITATKNADGFARFKSSFPLPPDSLEGYLYPETYRVVAKPFDVHALIQRQLDTFAARFFTPHKDEIARSGRSLHDIVRMASMLEREEPVPAQRPLVAGILWKRIDMGFPLGVDATSRYELDEWNDRAAFLKRLRDPADPYNSRLKAGLPPTPIGAPTVASLLAAMRPQKTDFLYYLHDADKKLHPSRNGEEHEALRRKYNVY